MSTIKLECTPVWTAAYYGHVDVVEFLVTKANANPNKPNKVLGSAECAWEGSVCACVSLFDTSAAGVICFKTAHYFSWSLRMYVCLYCVNMCTHVGGMISIIKDGTTPVHFAALEGRLDVVKFLILEANADPNKPKKVLGRVECAWEVSLCACVSLFDTSAACVICFKTAHYFTCPA